MRANVKRRLFAVTALIIAVVCGIFVFVSGSVSAKPISVAEVNSISANQKIQVTGNVVKDSVKQEDSALQFRIYDAQTDPAAQVQVPVYYAGGISDTFGNEIVAICTGKKNNDGVLVCSELVTKCPSKYETASDAISIGQLLSYGDAIIGSPVKVSGIVRASAEANNSSDTSFSILDKNENCEIKVHIKEQLPDGVTDGTSITLTGSLNADDTFYASEIALEG